LRKVFFYFRQRNNLFRSTRILPSCYRLQYQHAKSQVKQWELKERDALDAISVLLKDEREIKGLVNDELQTIARWKNTGGAEKIVALSKIKKDFPQVYSMLSATNLLEYQKTDRKPEIRLSVKE
jgi:hypothetical protein